VGGELREHVVSVDSVVDFTFPDRGVNMRDLGVHAAWNVGLTCFLTLAGMTVALYSDWRMRESIVILKKRKYFF